MRAGDRAAAVDAAAILLISLAICLASDRLAFMTVFVPGVIVARFWVWSRLAPEARPLDTDREVVLFLIATLIGGLNDWNSVVRHEVYRYRVPHAFPALSTIPLWMLLYWGVILRFLLTLGAWERVTAGRPPGDQLRLGRRTVTAGRARILFELLLVLATRQSLYRFHDHPRWSWLPFLLAVVLLLALCRPGPGEGRYLALVAFGGPAVELLYIHVGHLHEYSLGWLGGLPLWLVLWWFLGAFVWRDLGLRLVAGLARRRGLTPRPTWVRA